MTTLRPPRPRRGVLVVPGSNERMIDKALASGADEIVIDLEDAVTASRKDAARAAVGTRLESIQPVAGTCIAVRINALTTAWANDDLEMLSNCGDALGSVVVPKVDTAHEVMSALELLGSHRADVQALIETPLGVQNIEQICRSTTRLSAVIIGYADLGAALGRTSGLPPERWLGIQEKILVAARCCGIDAIDGPHLGVNTDEAFHHSSRWARELGFDGKWVVHPSQLQPVLTEFTPPQAAVDEARLILAALAVAEADGQGAAQLDGRMLDEAVAVAARRVLDRSGAST